MSPLPREPLDPQPTIISGVNPSYANDLHSPTVHPRPRPGPSQDPLQRRHLQLQPPRHPHHRRQPHQDHVLLRRLLHRPHHQRRHPSHWRPLYQDRPLQQLLVRRHQLHRHCRFQSPSSNPMTTPIPSPAPSTTPTKTGRENDDQSPCAAPPSASCRLNPLPPRRTTS